jgi:hypothetical protein
MLDAVWKVYRLMDIILTCEAMTSLSSCLAARRHWIGLPDLLCQRER